MKHQLSLSYKNAHTAILEKWQWFRMQLIKFHKMKHLPEKFSNTDGEISENKGVYEDDPRYYTVPPEFNYNWHCQKLRYTDGLQKVTITINNDDLYSYYQFIYEAGAPVSKISFFVSAKEQYLVLSKANMQLKKWIKACDGLE